MRNNSFNEMMPGIKNIIIVNVLIFVLTLILYSKNIDVFRYLGLHYFDSPFFNPVQLLTHFFLHSISSFTHIIFNMLGLYFIGNTLERVWGTKRFVIFYFICGIGAGIFSMGISAIELLYTYKTALPVTDNIEINQYLYQILLSPSVGASGAVMGCMGAFAYLFPNTEFQIFPLPIPIKAKYLALIYFAVDFYFQFISNKSDNIGHAAHIGGLLIGFCIVLYWNKTNKNTFY